MRSTEVYKVLGAVVMTALAVVVINFMGNILVPVDSGSAGGTTLAHAGGGSTAKPPIAKPKAEPKPVAKPKPAPDTGAVLAAGQGARGAKLARRKCGTCHTFAKGGANRVGPNLYAVVGRARAGAAGYRYSKALKTLGGAWTPASLFAFIANPAKFARGTKMNAKLAKPVDRADIVAYLRTLSDAPPAK